MHDPLRKGQFERQPLIQHGVAHRPHGQLDALVPGRHNVETAGDNNQRRDGAGDDNQQSFGKLRHFLIHILHSPRCFFRSWQ